MKLTVNYTSSSKTIVSLKHYFSNITSNGIITNKNFWKAIKPFLTNMDCLDKSDILLRDDEKIVTDEKKLV